MSPFRRCEAEAEEKNAKFTTNHEFCEVFNLLRWDAGDYILLQLVAPNGHSKGAEQLVIAVRCYLNELISQLSTISFPHIDDNHLPVFS